MLLPSQERYYIDANRNLENEDVLLQYVPKEIEKLVTFSKLVGEAWKYWSNVSGPRYKKK